MAIVDSMGRRCDKVLRVHFRQVNHTHFDAFQAVSRAQRIFGKYGILVQVASVRALRLSASELSRFAVVTTTCEAQARVAKSGAWVEMVNVGYAAH